MKKMLFVLAGLLMTAALAQTKIEVWYSLSNTYGAPEFEAFAEEFNRTHPDIIVDVVYSGGYSDTVKKAQAAVAAGKAPDVIMLEQTLGAGFVDAQAVVPLESFVEADADFALDDIYRPLLATCTLGGILYCLPFNTSTPLVYYNGDAFRDAGLDPVEDFPSTWDELLEVGPKLARTNAEGQPERWALGLATAPGWLFDAWLGQAGGRYLNESGDAFVFNDENSVQMLEFWLQLIEAGAARPSGSQTEDFYAGRQVMLMASTATLESRFNAAEFDLHVAPLWCGEECYAPIGGGNLYLMETRNDARKQAAWEFVTWVTNTENMASFAAATGYMAARQSSLETETMQTRFEQRPAARVTYEQMASHGYPRTLVPFWGDVNSQLTEIAERVMLNGEDPQTVLDQAVEEANRLLAIYSR